MIVKWRQKATAANGRHLDAPVIDMIELHRGQVASLQMFHLDTASVLEFLHATPKVA